jgi:hypothetical protein
VIAVHRPAPTASGVGSRGRQMPVVVSGPVPVGPMALGRDPHITLLFGRPRGRRPRFVPAILSPA